MMFRPGGLEGLKVDVSISVDRSTETDRRAVPTPSRRSVFGLDYKITSFLVKGPAIDELA